MKYLKQEITKPWNELETSLEKLEEVLRVHDRNTEKIVTDTNYRNIIAIIEI